MRLYFIAQIASPRVRRVWTSTCLREPMGDSSRAYPGDPPRRSQSTPNHPKAGLREASGNVYVCRVPGRSLANAGPCRPDGNRAACPNRKSAGEPDFLGSGVSLSVLGKADSPPKGDSVGGLDTLTASIAAGP